MSVCPSIQIRHDVQSRHYLRSRRDKETRLDSREDSVPQRRTLQEEEALKERDGCLILRIYVFCFVWIVDRYLRSLLFMVGFVIFHIRGGGIYGWCGDVFLCF